MATIFDKLKKRADEMRKFAEGYKESHTDHMDDAGVKKMIEDDHKEFMDIAQLIEEGNIDEACKKAEYMDTVPREMIPDSIWDFIHSF
jgi:hypothetical protein